MKHKWKELPQRLEDVYKYGFDPRRQCENCGVIQQRNAITAWMRTIGYRWLPLAGRCKGKNGGN